MSEIPGPSEKEMRQPEVQRRVGFWKSLFGKKTKEAQPDLSEASQVVPSVSPQIASAEKLPIPSKWEQAVIREHAKLEKQQQQLIDTQGAEALQVMMELGMYSAPEFSREENALWYEEMKKRNQNGELTGDQMKKVDEIHTASEGAATYSDWLNEEKALKDGMIPRNRLMALYKRRPEARIIMQKWLPIALREAKQHNDWEKRNAATNSEQSLTEKLPPRIQLTPEENATWRQMMELKIEMGLLSAQEQKIFRTTVEKTAYEDELAIQLFDELTKEETQAPRDQKAVIPFPQTQSSVRSEEKIAA